YRSQSRLSINEVMFVSTGSGVRHIWSLKDNHVWVRDDGNKVDLSRRSPLQRITLMLAKHWAYNPGRTISARRIAQLIWPESHVNDHQRFNRLRVAIADL